MDFTQALREIMEERKLRIEHIAIAANISTNAVRSYLNGRSKPSFDSAQAIRRAYPEFAAKIDQEAAA